jgi:serine protease Do
VFRSRIGPARATVAFAATVAIAPPGGARAETGPWDPQVLSEVAEKVTPAVVSLTSRTNADDRPSGSSTRGTGSGVIVTPNGQIVTSHHVIAGGGPIWATLADGRRFRAERLGGDPATDVAVVRIEAEDLPVVPLGDARALRLGELVLAVGNPFDVGQTVTLGIVSAKGRSSVGILDYEDFIQTDAAINPGNSGGALVDMDGELVGINTSIISRTGAAQGVGFAIPTHVVTWVRDQLLEHGAVRNGWLGIRAQALEPEIAEQLGIPLWAGVLVTDVVGAPARRAGLEMDDVITHVEGRPVFDPDQLRSRVGLTSPGVVVTVRIRRGERTLDVPVRLGESGWVEPEPETAPSAHQSASGSDPGVDFAPLDAELRRKLAVPKKLQGWVVTDVRTGSPAGRSRLEERDVVTSVDGRPFEDPRALGAALSARGHAVLRIYRRGSELFVVLRR